MALDQFSYKEIPTSTKLNAMVDATNQLQSKVGELTTIVNCAYNATDDNYTTDKTSDEVIAIIAAGGKVTYKVTTSEGDVIYFLADCVTGDWVLGHGCLEYGGTVVNQTITHAGSVADVQNAQLAKESEVAAIELKVGEIDTALAAILGTSESEE